MTGQRNEAVTRREVAFSERHPRQTTPGGERAKGSSQAGLIVEGSSPSSALSPPGDNGVELFNGGTERFPGHLRVLPAALTSPGNYPGDCGWRRIGASATH